MIRSKLFISMALAAAAFALTPASAQGQQQSVDQVLKKMGLEATRAIDTDICYPNTGEEYEALGKNAILMVKSSAAVSTELPLRTVYVIYKKARIALQRVALMDKTVDPETSKALQISFYLLPIQYMKGDTQLFADFAGERKDFGFYSFTAKGGLGKEAPAFARLDEYDTPGDADLSAVASLLAREYPQYVHRKEQGH